MWLPARQVEASPCQMKRGAEDVEDKKRKKVTHDLLTTVLSTIQIMNLNEY